MMTSNLKRLDWLRYEAEQVLAEAHVRRLPFGMAWCAVQALFRQYNVEPPEDVLAFCSGGRVSDSMIADWASPT